MSCEKISDRDYGIDSLWHVQAREFFFPQSGSILFSYILGLDTNNIHWDLTVVVKKWVKKIKYQRKNIVLKILCFSILS